MKITKDKLIELITEELERTDINEQVPAPTGQEGEEDSPVGAPETTDVKRIFKLAGQHLSKIDNLKELNEFLNQMLGGLNPVFLQKNAAMVRKIVLNALKA